ncbi:protein C8orf37 homolog [Gigantopelta aegis]|uniref:protein C8orf37 homolog n=1 Tax=Gigantopelta aegis TaxID=1735272 RepID=UPI001B889704|nr:protein C8orf37 homolog [Gigantopelta aegis]
MADDIDDLLDEVETKFCEKPQSNGRHNTTGTDIKRTIKNRSCLDDDIDQILNDVDDRLDNITCTDKKHGDASSNQARPESAKRCFPIYLGGASFVMGQGSAFNKKTCNKLRCTSCDFRVITFDNFKWDRNTDYLFLRNNVPEFQKLKSKLVSKKGYRSYCCQCTWKSVQDLEELKYSELKWVCGKHS